MRNLAAAVFAFVSMLSIGCAASAQERLVMAPYPSAAPWQTVTNKTKGLQHLREQIPAGQRIEAYRDILTDQAFPQQRGVAPSAFLKTIFQGASQSCESLRVNGPKAVVEDGYPVAYAQVYCSRQKGTAFGVDMFFKAIAGADALYVVQREFRVPPSAVGGVQSFSKAQVGAMGDMVRAQSAADAYLASSVRLCGARSKDRRCGK